MAARVIGSTSTVTTAQTIRVERPAGAQPGDLLVTFIGSVQDAGPVVLAGHTSLGVVSTGGSFTGRLLVAYRVVQAGDPDVQGWFFSGNTSVTMSSRQVLIRGQVGVPTAVVLGGFRDAHPGVDVSSRGLLLWAEQPAPGRRGLGQPPAGLGWTPIAGDSPRVLNVAQTPAGPGLTGEIRVTDYPASATGIAVVQVTSLNLAPTAPLPLFPGQGRAVDRDQVILYRWEPQDPDGDAQGGYGFRDKPVGSAQWTTLVSRDVEDHQHAVNSGTLPPGRREWQVQSKDTLGLWGPWSESVFYETVDAPSHTIFLPATPTVGQTGGFVWTRAAQDAYRVRFRSEDGGTTYLDTGWVETSFSGYDFDFAGLNGIRGVLESQIRVNLVESKFVGVTVTVAFTAPPVPAVTLTEVDTLRLGSRDSLDVLVRCALVPGTVEAVSAALEFRSLRLAPFVPPELGPVATNGITRWWTPSHLEQYRVRVTVRAANGATSASGWVSVTDPPDGPVVPDPGPAAPQPDVASGYAGQSYAGHAYAGGSAGGIDQGAYADADYDPEFYR